MANQEQRTEKPPGDDPRTADDDAGGNDLPGKPISLLEGDGITTGDIDKLRAAGLHTVEAAAHCTKKHIAAIRGISEQKATKILDKASRATHMGFETGTAILELRANIVRISTGSPELDRLLGGGVETGGITEIFGEGRSGKTQLCLALAIRCQLPVDLGGAEGKCLFIDTQGTFRPERIVDMANHLQLQPEDALDNVAVARARNTDHLTELLIKACALMAETRYAIVIVDSCISLYRTDFNGRGELAARQGHLAKFLRLLHKLTEWYGCAVVVTNEVIAVVDNPFGGLPYKPAGGHVMAHASTTRLMLRKGPHGSRICKVYSSPCLPEAEARFRISSIGIVDDEE